MNNKKELKPSYPTLDNLTFYSILGVLQSGMWLLNDIEEFLKQYNISHGRFSILLIILEKKEQPLQAKEVAQKLGKSRPTITNMINKLHKDGFITITHDKRDGRAKILSLTGKAVDFLNLCIPEYNKRIVAMSIDLSNEEKSQLMNILAKINFLDNTKKIVVKT
jgi:DNA-binding MarR family transcriptional regulator